MQSREILSEQLKLSRELTKKLPVDSESSGEEEDGATIENVESDNPWVGKGGKTEAEVDAFISGYRKFWDAKHQAQQEEQAEEEKAQEEEAQREAEAEALDERAQRLLKTAVVAASASVLEQDEEPVVPSHPEDDSSDDEVVIDEGNQQEDEAEAVPIAVKPVENVVKNPVKSSAASKRKADDDGDDIKKRRLAVSDRVGIPENLVNGQAEKVEIINSKSGKWTVTVKQDTEPAEKKRGCNNKRREINLMFNDMERKLQEKAEQKMRKLKASLGVEEGGAKKKSRAEKKARKADAPVVASLRGNRHQRPDEDEALDEQSGKRKSVATNGPSTEKEARVATVEVNGKTDAPPEIDPNNFLKTVRTQLHSAVPDMLANGDEGMDDDGDDNNQMTISEAFADDDVVAEFE